MGWKQFGKWLDIVTTPGASMLNYAGDSAKKFKDIMLKQGSFANAGKLERFGGMIGAGLGTVGGLVGGTVAGMTGGIIGGGLGGLAMFGAWAGGGAVKGAGRTLRGVAKGSGLDVAADKAGRGLKKVGQGIKTKFDGKMKTKTIQNSADDAADAATEAIHVGLTRDEAKKHWSWKDDDGNYYYRKVLSEAVLDSNGKHIIDPETKKAKRKYKGVEYYKQTPDGKVKIDGKEYGEARQKWINSLPEDVADDISKTETAERAGVNLSEFLTDHPVLSTAGLIGGGFLLSELLDDDD